MKIVAALVASLVIVSTAAFAQERPKSYDPAQGVPREAVAQAQPVATTADKVEAAKAEAMRKQEAEARARFAAWKQSKEGCYIEAGLSKESGDFIVKPGNALIYQIRDTVWLQPERFNLAKLRTCQ